MGVDTHYEGPLFNVNWDQEIGLAIAGANRKTADQGARLIKERLDTVLRHPTGHLESKIGVDIHNDQYVVTDGGVVYGPWIEGVSQRQHTSRFKGYATFRLVTQQLERDALNTMDDAIGQFVQDVS